MAESLAHQDLRKLADRMEQIEDFLFRTIHPEEDNPVVVTSLEVIWKGFLGSDGVETITVNVDNEGDFVFVDVV